MLQNAYFLAKIGADTAENEQHFAEILPKTGNYPAAGPPRAGHPRGLGGPAPPGAPGVSECGEALVSHLLNPLVSYKAKIEKKPRPLPGGTFERSTF